MSKPDVSQILGPEVIADLNKKKGEIEKARIETQHEQLQEQRKEMDMLAAFDLSKNDEEYINALAKSSTDYLTKAKKSKVFLNSHFKGKVPLFPRNLILLGAETGTGKSTISANLTYNALIQGQKVLVLTNEEHPADVYNRISCLIKGWFYGDHENFTPEQIQFFESNIVNLSKKLTVVGDSYNGMTGCTTTIEGLEAVLTNALIKNADFDLIILDYYQNVDRSVKVPSMADWQVQYRLCKFLDQYKNMTSAAIIALAQKKEGNKDKEIPFKEAIEGRKTIVNVSTCAINVIKDAELSRTIFEIKKSRFNACVGEKIYVGFDRGKYVEYTDDFKNEAMIKKEAKERNERMAGIKPSGIGG